MKNLSKKKLCKIIVFLFLCCGLSFSVFAKDSNIRLTEMQGTCGADAKWTLKDGTLTIRGTGDMKNWDANYWVRPDWDGHEYTPWHEYEIATIVIEDGITSIGECAFRDLTKVTKVSIPDSVTSIGGSAFYDCCSLENITIPENVTSIGDRAFQYCSSIKEFHIPKSVTSFGEFAFAFCTGITRFEIPSNITEINHHLFDGCSNLREVMIPDTVKSLGEYSFWGCSSLPTLNLSENVTSIGKFAFWDCTGMTKIKIPGSVFTIGHSAFRGCTGLNTIEFYGDAPRFQDECFLGTKVNAYYPEGNLTWTEAVMQNYSGEVTWIPTVWKESTFSDVSEDAYYYDAVLWAVENGITTGVSDTMFAPDDACTRGQAVTFLYRADKK